MAELHALRVDRARTRAALERTWAAGAAALVLPAGGSAAEVEDLLARLRPHALLELDARGRWCRHPLHGGPSVSDDVALVVATSGSTGRAKGVELQQRVGTQPREQVLHLGG
ncbi:MAG: hypothetical protein R6V28_15395, partial [Nitriliruptoraceae bacterium]